MKRRPHWDDSLIEAVRNAPPKRTLNDAQTYAVIAAVEDWQDRTQQARAMSMTDNEAAIARVRELADTWMSDGAAWGPYSARCILDALDWGD